MFKDLFPVRIYHTKISNVDMILDNLLPSLADNLTASDANHVDLGPKTKTTFNNHNQLQNNPSVESLVKELNIIINKCWVEFNYYPGLKPFINEMWFNETQPGGLSVLAHNHSPYPMVGVVYLKADKGMGNIIFENPNNLVVGTQPHNWAGTNDVNGGIQETLEIETGDVIIFPGWLRHRGEINQTDGNRYVISFNIGCTGDYPISTYLKTI
jgi:uncharacterized protein (TIGR02466 family)